MMEPRDYRITIREEHLFWLEVLEDHAHFVRDYLSPAETAWWPEADRYIVRFREAVEQAKLLPNDAPASSEIMIAFARMVYPLAEGYFRLEGQIQHLRLFNRININLTPSYFNGTLGENQEYLRMLGYWIRGLPAEPLTLTALLTLWLEDQQGHALLLQNHLDPVERQLSMETDRYASLFASYRLENIAMEEFLRFTPPGFLRVRPAGRPPVRRNRAHFSGYASFSGASFSGIVLLYAQACFIRAR